MEAVVVVVTLFGRTLAVFMVVIVVVIVDVILSLTLGNAAADAADAVDAAVDDSVRCGKSGSSISTSDKSKFCVWGPEWRTLCNALGERIIVRR